MPLVGWSRAISMWPVHLALDGLYYIITIMAPMSSPALPSGGYKVFPKERLSGSPRAFINCNSLEWRYELYKLQTLSRRALGNSQAASVTLWGPRAACFLGFWDRGKSGTAARGEL